MLHSEEWYHRQLDQLQEARLIAVDTETTGLRVKDGTDYLIGISVAYSIGDLGLLSCYFPLRHKSDNVNERNQLARLRSILEGKPLVFHNLKFDLHSLRTIGIEPSGRLFDTLNIAHMINEEWPNKSLDWLSDKFLKDRKTGEAVKAWAEAWGWGTIPANIMEPYAEQDARLTYRLFEILWPELRLQSLDGLWDIELAYCRLLTEIERNGVRVDQNFCTRKSEQGNARMLAIRDELGWSPSSPLDLSAFLLDELGYPVVHLTPGGKPSFDKKAMEEYDELLSRDGRNEARLVAEYRGWQKAVSSLYKSALSLVSPDGRIRPNFKQHGTKTGRLSCSEPNLQQIPRESKHLWNGDAKKSFVAADGFTLVEFDYCVGLDTKILGTDLVHHKAQDVYVGQELVGFDEDIRRQFCKMKSTVVEKVSNQILPCMKINLSNGESLTSSKDHRWSMTPKIGASLRQWKTTEQLKVGDRLLKYCDTWKTETSHSAGWLAGVYDGEGWVSGGTVGFAQNEGLVLEEYLNLMEDYGFKITEAFGSSTATQFRSTKISEGLKLLGSIRPIRLLAKSRVLWENKSPYGRYNETPSIISIEDIGLKETIAIKTSTKTFIADGYMSHNCQLEFRLATAYGRDQVLLDTFNSGEDVFIPIAIDVFGGPEHRQAAKTLVYSTLYGAGIPRLSSALGLTETDASAVRTRFRETYSGIYDKSGLAGRNVRKNGYVRYWTGRKRHLAKDATHKAFNSVIQGGAAELVKRSMLRVSELCDQNSCRMVLTVHDSIVLEIRTGLIADLVPRVISLMTDWPDFGVKFEVDAHVFNTGEKL